jgi:hypothetical protein
MNNFCDLLPPDVKARIEQLRHAIAGLALNDAPVDEDKPSTLIQRCEKHIGMLESWLLDTEQQQTLGRNPLNIFWLHAGAYMAELVAVSYNRHHLDTNSFIEEYKSSPFQEIDAGSVSWTGLTELGFKTPKDVAVAEAICRAAASSASADDDDEVAKVDRSLSLPLLVGGLRLARALDLSDGPARRAIFRLLPEGVDLFEEKLSNYFDIVATGPHRHFPGTIRVKIRCRHAEVHRALKRYETRVGKMLSDLNRRVSPRFLFSDCIFEIDDQGYEPMDLKFSVDSSAALQLFTGNRLYADRRAFLRELLQNAIDACHLRTMAQADYRPAITIRFQDNIRIVSVRDNGIGMDRQWIEKYFLQIGISFYQSGRIRRINRDRGIGLSFISQFGIGFLSSFLVAEKIIIRTRKADASGLQITISDLKEYFDVRPLAHDAPVGTEVILHLKPSRARYCRSLEYIGYLKTNIRFLKVPVELVDENNRSMPIGMEELAYPGDGGKGRSFVARLDLPVSEGFLLLQAKKQTSYIQGLELAQGGVSVFQDGIFVAQIETLLPEGARQHVIGRLNLEGADKCELSMDRNRIFWSEERLREIKQAVRQALADVVNRLLAAVDAQEAPVSTRESIVNQLAIFFDFNEVDDDIHARLCSPVRAKVEKRFRDFVRINFAHAMNTAVRPSADGYNEAWQQAILDGFGKRAPVSLQA